MSSSTPSADDRRDDVGRRASSGPTALLRAVVLSALVFGAVGFVVGQSTASGDEGGGDPVAEEDPEGDDATRDPAADDAPDDGSAGADDGSAGADDEASGREGIDEIAAELREGQDDRHVELVASLTETATTTHDELLEVLAELHDAVPADGGEGEPAGPDELEAWRATLQDAHDRLTGLGPGSTAVNGTRGTFVGTVRQLDAAVSSYEEALQAEDGDQRARLIDLAAELRDDAAALWTVGAEQLDLLNIDVHGGHVHLYLPDTGDPDTLPDEFREPVGHDHGSHDQHDDEHDDDHGDRPHDDG